MAVSLHDNLIGPTALAATLSIPRPRAKGGPVWQYHSRSDHHSKTACVLMQVDLMLASRMLREDVAAGRVACGINHVMQDHRSNRKKAFDLVIHRPAQLDRSPTKRSFKSLMREYGIVLTFTQAAAVDDLPDIPVRRVPANGVYVAWEAKAAMTEFGKARPRLFDELNSSHLTIHGDTRKAIAGGLVLVNAADSFISPIRNKKGPQQAVGDLEISLHRQPADFVSIVRKVDELPRRSADDDHGFDAIGIVGVDCRNDNSPVRLVTQAELRPVIDRADAATLQNFDYGRMINRVAHLYETWHQPRR